MKGILFLSFCILLSAASVSAAPFSVKALVNGVDPSSSVAVVRAGEPVQVSVDVSVTGGNVMITGAEFNSEPSVLGAVAEAYFEKRVELPHELTSDHYSEYYDLPGFMPSGDYSIKASLFYSGGVYDYSARISVENEGALSTVLGLLLKILPKALVKPLVSLLL